MTAWLIYTEYESIRNKQYIEFYMVEGRKLGIEFQLLLAEDIEIGVKDGNWYLLYQGARQETPAFVICRMMHSVLSEQLESMGIRVYNNSMVSSICNDKARTYQYVARAGVPMVDTLFVKCEFAENQIKNADLPCVVKTTNGHGGSEVFLLENPKEATEIAKILDKRDVVIQPYISKSKQDLRVYVVGKEIIAAVLRTAKEGFRSNFCLGGNVELYTLSSKEMTIVNKIIQLFDFGLVGIDFIIGDHGELLFNEIEDVVGSRMLYQCTDLNIVKKYLEFILRDLT